VDPKAGLHAGDNKNLPLTGTDSRFSYYSASDVVSTLTELSGSPNNRTYESRDIPVSPSRWPHQRGALRLQAPGPMLFKADTDDASTEIIIF
jgi:hypothetical protein